MAPLHGEHGDAGFIALFFFLASVADFSDFIFEGVIVLALAQTIAIVDDSRRL